MDLIPTAFATADRAVGSLANSVFLLLSQIPTDAREYLFSLDSTTETIAYWYGQHPWDADGFEGPAALLRAIAHDPVTSGPEVDRLGNDWRDVLIFASTAIESLGGRPDLNYTTTTDGAKCDIAEAMAAFIPEIAAILDGAARSGTDWLPIADVLRDGTYTPLRVLHVNLGNLARALGVATTNPDALAVFLGGIRAYSADAYDHVVHVNGLTTEHAERLCETVGGIYGLTYSSYSLELAIHADEISRAHQEAIDRLFFIAGFLPFGSTGGARADWAIQAATVIAPGGISAIDSQILSDSQLAAIQTDVEAAGRDTLAANAEQGLGRHLPGAARPYQYSDESGGVRYVGGVHLADRVATAYDKAIAMYGNGNTTGTTEVELSQQDGAATREDVSRNHLPTPVAAS
jgi:hypothetical protein